MFRKMNKTLCYKLSRCEKQIYNIIIVGMRYMSTRKFGKYFLLGAACKPL